MSSILNIGQTALIAAQAGLATTGHNIANAATPGYNRQRVVQAALAGQNQGFGYVGRGTEVAAITRVYNEFVSNQVVSAQSNMSRLETFYTQSKYIDSLVADPKSGLSPALQDFFKTVQNNSGSPNGAETRQALLSSANSLVAGYRAMDQQLDELNKGINSELTASVTTINATAQQLAQINDSIEKAMGAMGSNSANDLLDLRDQLITDLAKEINVSVVKHGNSLNVFIGNGQPLVMGTRTFNLTLEKQATNTERLAIGYQVNDTVQMLQESTLTSGRISGLLEFRSRTLDTAKGELGRMAAVMAMSFNEQHRLGITQTGEMGGDFFKINLDISAKGNAANSTAVAAARLTDYTGLTTSDYRLDFDGLQYKLTRLSDGKLMASATDIADFGVVDGLTLSMDGTPQAGESFFIRPMAGIISEFGVAVTNRADVAVAAPIRTNAPLTNTGTGSISAGKVTQGFVPLNSQVRLSLDTSVNPDGDLVGFPSGVDVTMVVNGVETTIAAGDPVPYTAGATYRFGGTEVVMTGQPTIGAVPLSASIRLTLDTSVNPAGDLVGFPSGADVTMILNGVETTIAAGDPVPYDAAASYRFNGIEITMSGPPDNGEVPFNAAISLTLDTSVNPNGDFVGFPIGSDVTISLNGVDTTIAAGDPVPYIAGASYRVDGVEVAITGQPTRSTVPLSASLTLTFDTSTNPDGNLVGFPNDVEVTVIVNGVETTIPAGDPVPFTAGATYRFHGMEVTISGQPRDGDNFQITNNQNVAGDGRNAVLLGNLQESQLVEGNMTLQGAYAQMVSVIGNLTREAEVTSAGAQRLYTQSVQSQQSMSGVNLDEEASNLIRYQQAYQAAGKVMQTATVLFETLLSIGR